MIHSPYAGIHFNIRTVGTRAVFPDDSPHQVPHSSKTLTRKTRTAVIALGLLAIACGQPEHSGSSNALASPIGASPTSTTTSSPQATLTVANSRYGRIIVDRSGRTLYMFDIERDGQPRCYGACAVSWPPLVSRVDPVTGSGLDQALVTTAARKEGSRQVTYKGHPLYYYVGDRSPGEIKCQAVFEYGGGWYVLDVNGDKITAR
jgi:predicted lipoprotein with Yx(FWY)xxD motif